MPAFIHVNCACGREVRAKSEQAGGTVRCWSCGRDVPVPLKTGGRLAAACGDALGDALRGPVVGPIAVGALVVVLLLIVPTAGAWLGFAALAAAAWFYQGLIAGAVASLRPSVPRPTGELDAVDGPGRKVLRAVLSVVAAAALVAPFLVRNGGHLLVGERHGLGSRTGMLAALLVGWVVVPLVLLVANARDRFGPIPPWQALRGVIRHPLASLAAVAVVPLGMLAVEFLTVGLAAEQGILGLMISDMFPTPRLVMEPNGARLIYHYDDATLRSTFFADLPRIVTIYLAALRRGYTLVSAIPFSLTSGWGDYRIDPLFYNISWEIFLVIRGVFAALILAAAGVLLSVQARWLGLVGAIDRASLPTAREAASAAAAAASANGPVAAAAPPARAATAPGVSGLFPSPVAAPPPAGPSPGASGLMPSPRAAALPVGLPPGASGVFPAPAVAAPPARPPAVAPAAPSPAPAPAATPQADPSPGATGLFPFPAPLPGSPKILIIDDERAFAHALSRILVGRGFTVLLAGDAAEGVQLALTTRPDLIVLDLLLPDRPGMDVCRELRASEPTRNTPIVVATYKTGAEDEIAGLSHGADDYIAKPYVVEVLIARIQKQLQRRRP